MRHINVLETVKTDLLTAGCAEWPRISKESGVALSFLRKLAYGDRTNPRLENLQALLDYFAQPGRGSKRKQPATQTG